MTTRTCPILGLERAPIDRGRQVDQIERLQQQLAGLLANASGQVGHRVRTAADGSEALAAARQRWADLILLDLQLPGLVVLVPPIAWGAFEAFAGLPIIATTAAPLTPSQRPGLDVSTLLNKRLAPDELLEVVDRVVSRRAAGGTA